MEKRIETANSLRWFQARTKQAKTSDDQEHRARLLSPDRSRRCPAGPLDEASSGAAYLALFAYPGHPWVFSTHPYGEHRRGFQPVRRLERALESSHADRIFRDRTHGGFRFALEKPPCSRGHRHWLVADYGRSFGESLGPPDSRTRRRLSPALREALSVAGV